jgi:23S rRNA (pseudouridine1915-N3)-methyltransferase
MANRIRMIAFGKVKERNLQTGIDEYKKRLHPLVNLEILELKDEGIIKESSKIEKYLDNNSYILDEKGKQFTSGEFALFLKNNEKLSFIVGGPLGIMEDTKKKAKSISLSKMTFTHEMARLFLIEQIYRACMINSGRTYYNK